MTRQRLSLLLVIGVIATIIGLAVGVWRLKPSPVVASASWVFELSFPDAQGHPVPLSTVRGRLTVVNFWATWCPPCVDEMPELSRIHAEMSPNDIKIIGLAVDSPSNVRAFTAQHRFSYPLLITGGSGTELAKKLGNAMDALPYTVLIDEKGSVLKQKAGRIREEELKAWIAEVR